MAYDPNSFAPSPYPLTQQTDDRRRAILAAMQSRLQPIPGLGNAPPVPGAPMQSASMNPQGQPMQPSMQPPVPPPVQSSPMPMPMSTSPRGFSAPQEQMTMPGNTATYAPPKANYGGGDIQNLITKEAQAAGVDPQYMLAVAHQESGFNPTAKSKVGSAGGLYGFTNGTWDTVGRGDKYNPNDSIQAALKLTKNNQSYLKKQGIDPTPGATYLAHFFGAGGAAKVLKNPNDPVEAHLGAKVIKANPFLAGKTGNEMLAWAGKKMGYSPTPSSVGNLAPKPAPAPTFMKPGVADLASGG